MFDLNKYIKSILAIIVVVMGLSYFYMCSIRNIKPDPQILIAIVGSLGTCLGYFFGSASGSNKSSDGTASVNNADTVNVNQGK